MLTLVLNTLIRYSSHSTKGQGNYAETQDRGNDQRYRKNALWFYTYERVQVLIAEWKIDSMRLQITLDFVENWMNIELLLLIDTHTNNLYIPNNVATRSCTRSLFKCEFRKELVDRWNFAKWIIRITRRHPNSTGEHLSKWKCQVDIES